MKKKIALILGTRPEIIKLMSIIKLCERENQPFIIIHTNQHYSPEMDQAFFEDLHLPPAQYNLHTPSGSHGTVTGQMMISIEEVLEKERPDIVLVQGDTNTVLAGALTAAKMNILVGHIEAGLRSGDRTMPEEINRIVTDHVSDYLFAPTELQKDVLLSEGIDTKKIIITGNTVVDAVYACTKIADASSTVLEDYTLAPGGYILATLHRPATVDHPERLHTVLHAIAQIARDHDKKVILPLHPRTQKNLDVYGIKVPEEFILTGPIGYLDMLKLQRESFLIMTDSGGIQEESCILQKKCVVLRDNTERPEAVDVGGCVLAGNSDEQEIITKTKDLLTRTIDWHNPFGDGTTSQQIFEIITAKK